MGSVVQMFPDKFPSHDSVAALRKLADLMESGEFDSASVTVCNGADIWHFGEVCDSEAAVKAHWNMSYGVARLMRAAVEGYQDGN